MTVVGEAFVEIRPKDDDFRKDLDRDVSKAVSSTDAKVPLRGEFDEKGARHSIMGAVGGIAAAVGGAFVLHEAFDFVKAGVEALGEIDRISGQTTQVIKSTGGAANVTAQQVRDYANAIEAKTGIEAESVQEGQNLLLTFTNVQNRVGKGNDVFDQATSILTDMSVALGTDVSGSAVQLGKALNDPIAGVSALSRVGVTFSEDQKKMIKSLVDTGDVAGAQKVILGELNKEFGGSAEAFGNTGPGKMAKFRNAVGDVQEGLARGLIPVLTAVASFATGTLLPAFSTFAEKVGPVLGRVFSMVREGFQGWQDFGVTFEAHGPFEVIGHAIGEVLALIEAFRHAAEDGVTDDGIFGTVQRAGIFFTNTFLPALRDVAGFIGDHLKPILIGAFLAFTGPITAVIAVLALLYVRFQVVRDVVDTVVTFFIATFKDLSSFVSEVMPQIQEAIGHVMVVIQTIIEGALTAIRAVWSVVGDDVLRIVGAVFGQIKNTIEFAVNTIAGIIRLVLAVINGDWGKAWEAIKDIFGGVVDFVIGTLKSLGGILAGLLGAAFDAARRGIAAALPPLLEFVGSIPGKIVDGLGALGSLLLQSGIDMIEGFIRGIRNTAGKIITAIKEAITDKLPGFVKDALGIKSPSRVFEALGAQVSAGFAGGIAGGQGAIDAAMARLASVPSIDPLIASATGTNPASGGAARGPAVWIDKYEAHDEADVDVLIRRTEFAVQSGTL